MLNESVESETPGSKRTTGLNPPIYASQTSNEAAPHVPGLIPERLTRSSRSYPPTSHLRQNNITKQFNMSNPLRRILTIVWLLAFSTLALSSTPLFCKCICGKQSKIILLKEAQDTCATCTRQYCHSYNMPICHGYEDKEGERGIVTECFRT